MLATRELVDSFHEYAVSELRNGGTSLTIDELYDRWRELREREETIRAVKKGMEQIERGECMTLEEAQCRIRQKLQTPCSES